jgi:hypothetical protein
MGHQTSLRSRGEHGSIAVTERIIKTLKYEWLRCVPIIKGFDHLTLLCIEFEAGTMLGGRT